MPVGGELLLVALFGWSVVGYLLLVSCLVLLLLVSGWLLAGYLLVICWLFAGYW